MDRERMKNRIVMLVPVTMMLFARFTPSGTVIVARPLSEMPPNSGMDSRFAIAVRIGRPLRENTIMKIIRNRPKME
jgi:hypothetical protein